MNRYYDTSRQITEKPEDKKKRGRSPFRFFSKKRGDTASAERTKSKKTRTPEAHSVRIGGGMSPTARSVGLSNTMLSRSPTMKQQQGDNLQAGSVPQQKQLSVPQASDVESVGNEIYDAECLKLVNEYFYGVRIFPGQDPTHTYVGWVTTQYHFYSKEFNQNHVLKSSVVIADDYDRIVDRQVPIIELGL
ncbi:hypothetical protein D910_06048 [Dendroctonus ponderosae]|uniref:Uncharacterized protein n=1 Tax=Dendroctonus ponderosae TaxID=77166 RepID=U4U435_DENPD|nr:hypothetical protein D910_06048 [Dendroctonus ponderosae]